MRRAPWLAMLLALVGQGAAHAGDEDFDITDVGVRFLAPDGFEPHNELIPPVVHAFHDPARMLGVPYRAGGMAFTTKGQSAVLYVLWRVSNSAVADPGALIRAELEDFFDRPGASQIAISTEKVGDKLAGSKLDYKPSEHTYAETQAIYFVDGDQRVHVVRVECLVPEEHLDDAAPLCGTAVASLQPSIPPEKLSLIGMVPPPPPKRAKPAAVASSSTAAAAGTMQLATGKPAPAPDKIGPIVVTPDPPSGLPRILMFGGSGLVVVAVAVTLVSRRRRKA